jgi:hypothetical protein
MSFSRLTLCSTAPDFRSSLDGLPKFEFGGLDRRPVVFLGTPDGAADQRQISCILSARTPSYVMNAKEPSVAQKGHYE